MTGTTPYHALTIFAFTSAVPPARDPSAPEPAPERPLGRDLLQCLLQVLVVVGAVGDVGQGDDAEQAIVPVDHRDAPHLLAAHQLDHLADRLLGGHAVHVVGHEL